MENLIELLLFLGFAALLIWSVPGRPVIESRGGLCEGRIGRRSRLTRVSHAFTAERANRNTTDPARCGVEFRWSNR